MDANVKLRREVNAIPDLFLFHTENRGYLSGTRQHFYRPDRHITAAVITPISSLVAFWGLQQFVGTAIDFVVVSIAFGLIVLYLTNEEIHYRRLETHGLILIGTIHTLKRHFTRNKGVRFMPAYYYLYVANVVFAAPQVGKIYKDVITSSRLKADDALIPKLNQPVAILYLDDKHFQVL